MIATPTLFVVILNYIKEIEDIEKLVNQHVEFLKENYQKGNFIVSGARVPRFGGVILVKAKDRIAVQEIIEKDPFHKGRVAEYQIIEFNASRYAEGFEKWLS